MKTLTTIIATIALTLTTANMANAANVVAKDDSITSSLCVTAVKGNKFRMLTEIKSVRLSKAFVVKNVQCNEQSIISFVERYGKNADSMNSMLTNGNYQNQTKVNIIDIAAL